MEKALAVKDYCTKARRQFHQNPELSFQEFETTEYIKKELAQMGIEMLPVDKTGVVGVIRGGKGDGVVTGLRADIDALPLPETSGAPWASQNEGVAHSCGHDGHAATLLGVAKILSEMKDQLSGTIKLVFQPAEEGLGGALQVVKSGALDNPKPEAIVCLHCWPYLNAGEVGAWPGQYMASADTFSITVNGQGGHGARPYKAVNPIVAASLAVVAIQNITASEIVTAQQAVVTVCTFHAGTAFNIIPDFVTIGGTVRCLDPGVRDELEARIKRTAKGTAESVGCTAEVEYKRGVPSTINDPGVVEDVLKAAATALGEDKVKELDGPVMGSEDFSHLINHVGKGVFFRLGMGTPGVEGPALHNGAFDCNDEALPTGVATMVQYILDRHS